MKKVLDWCLAISGGLSIYIVYLMFDSGIETNIWILLLVIGCLLLGMWIFGISKLIVSYFKKLTVPKATVLISLVIIILCFIPFNAREISVFDNAVLKVSRFGSYKNISEKNLIKYKGKQRKYVFNKNLIYFFNPITTKFIVDPLDINTILAANEIVSKKHYFAIPDSDVIEPTITTDEVVSNKDAFVKALPALIDHSICDDPSYVIIDYPNGDVNPKTGVCTDVIIRAYRKIGIDLQKEVHEDMKANFNKYPKKWKLSNKPDSNIDHRRVPNLMTFFSRHGEVLKITKTPKDYQPGDIVCWELGDGRLHIGIVSNTVATDRIPASFQHPFQSRVTDTVLSDPARYMILHNNGNGQRLDDILFVWKIIGHYRFFKEQEVTASEEQPEEKPESTIKAVIANFYTYRDEKRLFEGFGRDVFHSDDGISPLRSGRFPSAKLKNLHRELLDSDTLLIFNFEKGTVAFKKRPKYLSDNTIQGYLKEGTKTTEIDNEGNSYSAIISGDFNGDGKKDYLTVDSFDIQTLVYNDISFVFSDKTIPKLKKSRNHAYMIKNIGDLDSDGGDEIGYFAGWGPKKYQSYTVYTLKDNKWCELISISATLDMLAAGIIPIEKDPELDSVLIVRSSMYGAVVYYESRTPYVVEKSVKLNPQKPAEEIFETESKLLPNLIRLSKQKVNVVLSPLADPIEPVPFTEEDWEKVKKGYNQWRNAEIAKGNYLDTCLSRKPNCALPKLPELFGKEKWQSGRGVLDTLMADINFDGKPDVIFQISPEDCFEPHYTAWEHQTMYLSFLSKGDEYVIDKRNFYLNAVIRTLKSFQKQTGHDYDYEIFDTYNSKANVISIGYGTGTINSIKSKNGIIEFSGNWISRWPTDYDPLCCPGFIFLYDFNYYIDRYGNGYADIKGTYANIRESTEQDFEIRFK